MPRTYLALYKPGPVWNPGVDVRDQPPPEHGRYLLGLFAKGILKSAGPFADSDAAAVVVEAEDKASAEALIADDPAVVAGVFVTEVHEWSLVPWESYLRT